MMKAIDVQIMICQREEIEAANRFINGHSWLQIKKIVTLEEAEIEEIRKSGAIIFENDWGGVIRKSLERLGLRLHEDFFYSWMLDVSLDDRIISYEKLVECSIREKRSLYDFLKVYQDKKQVAYVFGNCQIYAIAQWLLEEKRFAEKYYIVLSEPVHRLGEDVRRNGLKEEFLRELSLFVYQYIETSNSFSRLLGTEYILSKLSNECKKICIPNMYFTGYFPQFCKVYNSPLKSIKKFSNGLIPYGDRQLQENSEKYCKREIGLEVIIQNLQKADLYSREEILDNVSASLDELKHREKKCQIIISDYIVAHYREKRLFYAVNHPADDLIKEMVKRILVYLGYTNPSIMEAEIKELDEIEEFIFPCVKEQLELKFEAEKARLHKSYCNLKFDIREYAATYIKEYLYMQIIEQQSTKYENFEKVCVWDDGYIELKRNIVLTSSSLKTGHLSIYFSAKKVILNEIVIWIPYKIAPKASYNTCCLSIEGEICPMTINEIGEVRINMCRYKGDIKRDLFVIDTMWNIKE